MAHMGEGRLEAAETVLKAAGFTMSRPCISRPSCFDFAVRREGNLILVKILPDIGNLTLIDSQELGEISGCFSAASMIIGQEARERPLEDDTIYRRYNISAVNLKTFENVVLHNVRPLIQANPGGYYVEIDGGAIRQRRQDLGLSVGEVADMVGISRRTIYGYERGLAKASVPAAYKLVWALGIPVAKSMDIFQTRIPQRQNRFLRTAKRAFARSRLLNKIFKKLALLQITTVKKAPFDFVMQVSEPRMQIVGGVADAEELELSTRIDEILSVSKVIGAHPILISEGPRPCERNIPYICCEDFSRIKNQEDLIQSVK
jgi:putative transcriptional regulator